MIDVMFDCETTGLDPSHSQILQISAVRFDLESKAIHPDMFDQCLQEAPGRWWDESTREWWTGEKKWPVYCSLVARARPAEDVLREFQQWSVSILSQAPIRFWSKPTSFDFPFIASYFKQYGLDFPYHYRHAKDLNTYIFGRGHTDIEAFWRDVEPVGSAHNALHDVLYQIRGVFQA